MTDEKKESSAVTDAETMNWNDNCGRDVNVVSNANTLEDGIIELTDEKTNDRYFIDRPD